MTTLLAGVRPAADHAHLAELLLAEIEVERLEDIMEASAAALAHAVPVWRAARGSQRIVSRRRAASAILAMKSAAGALAQARRTLVQQRSRIARPMVLVCGR